MLLVSLPLCILYVVVIFVLSLALWYLLSEYLAPGAIDPVNVDSRVAEIVRRNMQNQIDRYCFDEAEVSFPSNY